MKQKISPVQKALNLWAIILIVWAFYRAKIPMPIWFDEFVAKPLVFILPVYYYITKREKMNFFAGINFYPKKITRDLTLGSIIGIVLITTAILTHLIRTSKLINLNLNQLSLMIVFTLAAAISEEILSRGFILKRLYQDSKNKLSASFFASILYFFLHIPIIFTNPQINSNSLFLFMTIEIIFSLIISLIFIDYGLLLAILIHFFYSLSLSILF
jgi:membrane protease YdiL (CAAX protease family)